MPNYVAKQLTRYKRKAPKRPQNCPFEPEPVVYGRKSQEMPKKVDGPPVSKEEKVYIQQVIGSFLYYARAIDMTILHALSAITAEQANPTESTMKRVKHLLDYMHSNPNAIIRFRASDMILNVHSDASYLTASRGRSRAGGYFFLGSLPRDDEPIWLNGNIHITCAILKLVADSVAEAELGALFINDQEAKIIHLILEEMGHPQPPTPIHVDNTTTAGIINNTIKRQRLCAMEMRYFWLLSQEAQKMLDVSQHPGAENMGDYPSKAHTAPIFRHVRPYFVHMKKLHLVLPRAPSPSSRQGCAETLGDPYIRGLPLPRIPISHKLKPDNGQTMSVQAAAKWTSRA